MYLSQLVQTAKRNTIYLTAHRCENGKNSQHLVPSENNPVSSASISSLRRLL
jgi:hypothetical protein